VKTEDIWRPIRFLVTMSGTNQRKVSWWHIHWSVNCHPIEDCRASRVLCHPNVFFGHDLTWRSSKRAHLLAAVTCPLKEMAMMNDESVWVSKIFFKTIECFLFLFYFILKLFNIFRLFWFIDIKTNFLKIKNIILIYFQVKNTLKNNRYHTLHQNPRYGIEIHTCWC